MKEDGKIFYLLSGIKQSTKKHTEDGWNRDRIEITVHVSIIERQNEFESDDI